MATPKKYFQDRLILLLLSVNVFLAFSAAALILARLSSGHGNTYIVQYRSSLGINAFQTGGVSELLSFILFAFIILAVHISLSLRMYAIRRYLATIVLAVGILLLILCIIISNALLVLR